ncbi:unnamed protein product [Heterosigma akashiwo]
MVHKISLRALLMSCLALLLSTSNAFVGQNDLMNTARHRQDRRALCPAPVFNPQDRTETRLFAEDKERTERTGKGYASDGVKEAKILFGLLGLLLIRNQFSTIELRTTSVCPGGPEAERSIQRFKANDDTFHCLPAGELAWKVLTDKWVFPGDPEFDTQIIRIEMKGVKK